MTISRTKAVQTINRLFSAIPYLSASWSSVADKLYDMNEAAERQHRRGRGRQPLSVPNAAKYFTVKHLLEALQNPNRYTVQDIISIRTECLYAQAYAVTYKEELSEWRKLAEDSDFADVDYADLMTD